MTGIFSLNAFKVFLLGCILFMLAFAMLSLGKHHEQAVQAMIGMALVIATSVATYAILDRVIVKPGPFQRDASFQRAEFVLWALMVGFSCLGAVLFLLYAQTTAALELIRHMLDADYVSPFGELERRLATTGMPIWVQIVFEAARRFAMPFALLHYFVLGNPVAKRPIYTVILIALALFFAFWTLDRVIPVMYAAMLYGAHFFRTKANPLTDKWFYITVVTIMLVVTGMKNIQYGEFREMDLTSNSTISEFLGNSEPPSAGADAAGAPAVVHDPVDYVRFMVLSVVERVLLSPVAMTIYAFEEYDESNFTHWSSTRIFSIFGFGHFVSSLETGDDTKYHDAFPVTFLGDLWRNGGQVYMPVFGILAGLLLLGLDRTFFNYATLPTWQILVIFGIAFWFYGNAVNATMVLLCFGSLGSFAFAMLLSRFLDRR